MKLAFVPSVLFLLCSISVFSQNAGNIEFSSRKCNSPVFKESDRAYEDWMKGVLEKQNQFANGKKISVSYNIPVIFHIIHSGQAVGNTYNISQAQVNSQIRILNEAFRKTNTDQSTYVTQAGLSSLAADCEISFCAATVDTAGNALTEPGIDRILASSKGWTNPGYSDSYIETTIKPNSVWNSSKYLNIWILNFSDPQELGYAQFPTVPSASTPTIGDLAGSGLDGPAKTDGVVFGYKYIGDIGTATAPFNKGRTAVHEIGHWLGLWHIWGDESGCSGTDYVADTPNQGGENYTCPATNGAVVTDACTATSPGVNYQNYMDYSDDKCMVMFTEGQKARMQACMQYCPRRAALVTSTVCNAVGIKENQSTIELSIYPNPSEGELFVDLKMADAQDFTISVVNTLGQTIKEVKQVQSNGGKIKIDLSDKNTGVYFVTLKSKSGGSKVKRIVLQ
jgi:hypothetical protein